MKETLCWLCRRPGSSSCAWDRSFDPVPGWTAAPGSESLIVKKCPEFLPVALTGRGTAIFFNGILDMDALGLLFDGGLNDSEISRQTGLSRRTVRRRRAIWLEAEKEDADDE